jgi:hypothetical protein
MGVGIARYARGEGLTRYRLRRRCRSSRRSSAGTGLRASRLRASLAGIISWGIQLRGVSQGGEDQGGRRRAGAVGGLRRGDGLEGPRGSWLALLA